MSVIIGLYIGAILAMLVDKLPSRPEVEKPPKYRYQVPRGRYHNPRVFDSSAWTGR